MDIWDDMQCVARKIVALLRFTLKKKEISIIFLGQLSQSKYSLEHSTLYVPTNTEEREGGVG